jgi:bile acid:Na+ symporter, BASS family
MELQQFITWALQLSILLVAFGYGLEATTTDARDLMRRPELLGRSFLATFVIVPIVAVVLVRAFQVPNAADVALVALAISPLPALMPSYLITAVHQRSYPVGPTVMIAMLSIAIIPLLVALVGRYLGPSVVSPLRAASVIAVIVVLPLVAGMAVRALRPALADRVALPSTLLGTVLLRLATVTLLVTSLPAIWALIANGTVIAVAILVVVGFAVGHWLGGPDHDGRTVLALTSGFHHPAVTLAIAAVSPSDRYFAAAIVLYLLLGDIVGLPYTIWRQRNRGQPTDAEAAAIVLGAREKAVDDVRAGRAAPYHFAPPSQPSSSDGVPASRSTDGGEPSKRNRH